MDCDESAVSSSTPSVPCSSGIAAASATPPSLIASSVKVEPTPGAAITDAPVAVTQSSQKARKSWKRKNAWGNRSYADLIYCAIDSSTEKRLTLAQIYEWLIHNIDYFRQNSDNKSSIGWKNSIRHNLSLHSRFIRIQNDGAGKSSWWTIIPSSAAPHKNLRRKSEGAICHGSGNNQSIKTESAKQPTLYFAQWNNQDRFRYYQFTSDQPLPLPPSSPVVDVVNNCVTSLPKVGSSDHAMLVAQKALRNFSGIEWKSGFPSAECNSWRYPIGYKRCLNRTRWTTGQGYYHLGGRGQIEWTADVSQRHAEFGSIDQGRVGLNNLPSSFAIDFPKAFDRNIYDTSSNDIFHSTDSLYSQVPHYSSHETQCHSQSNSIVTSSLTSLSTTKTVGELYAPPQISPCHDMLYLVDRDFSREEQVTCRASVTSMLPDPTVRLLNRHDPIVSSVQSPTLPMHRWTVNHPWQSPTPPHSKKPFIHPDFCPTDLERPNRTQNSSYIMLTSRAFDTISNDQYDQYYPYNQCNNIQSN